MGKEYGHSVQRKLQWPPQKKAKMVSHLTCHQKYKLNDILNISHSSDWPILSVASTVTEDAEEKKFSYISNGSVT